MTSLSDTLTVGLVMILLFGSIALYLYTCIQQSEQKISLLESILLDLKMSNEIKSYSELPADEAPSVEDSVHPPSPASEKEVYEPFLEEDASESEHVVDMEELTPLEESTDVPLVPNYEAMTLKELQAAAKARGITGLTKKSALVDALKETVKPGSSGTAGSNSFLETSAIVSSIDA